MACFFFPPTTKSASPEKSSLREKEQQSTEDDGLENSDQDHCYNNNTKYNNTMDFLLKTALNKSGRASFKITGSYILDSYDENLERWLDSMGINGKKMGPVFRKTKVKIMVKEPSKYNKKWNWAHREEGEVDYERAVSYTFEPGKPFSYELGGTCKPRNADEAEGETKVDEDSLEDDGSAAATRQDILCKESAPNVIYCHTEVPRKDWAVETRVMFTPDGITAVMTNKKENISMSVKYSRMIDPWAAKKKKFLMAKKL